MSSSRTWLTEIVFVKYNMSIRCELALTGATKWMLVKDMGVGRDCSMRDLGEVCGTDCVIRHSSTSCLAVSVPDGERGFSVLFTTRLCCESVSVVTEGMIPEVASWKGLDAAPLVKKLARSMENGLYSKGVCGSCSPSNGACAVCSSGVLCSGFSWAVLEPCVASTELLRSYRSHGSSMVEVRLPSCLDKFMRQNQA
jgi:hypothetical protein